ncbi:MAG: sulfotransferase domain-containing protein [Henriciella sp.]|nr:sulfotransferase domain-containing protein [Henriciella sp.]
MSDIQSDRVSPKSKLKSLLFRHGLDVSYVSQKRRAKLIGLPRIRPDHVFMCSYPRSGNTWTRMIVACLLNPDLDSINLDGIDTLVPDIAEPQYHNDKARVYKDHRPAFDLFPRVIYNYRDGRDCLVSEHKYAVNALGYTRSRKEFVTHGRGHTFGMWHEHIDKALAFQTKYPDRILMLRYESMRDDPRLSVTRIAEFLGIRLETIDFDRILDLTNLNTQRGASEQHIDPRKRHTIGSGKVGGWKQALDASEIELFEAMSAKTLMALDYPLLNRWAGETCLGKD